MVTEPGIGGEAAGMLEGDAWAPWGEAGATETAVTEGVVAGNDIAAAV